MASIPPLPDSFIRGIADVLGETDTGLTNREIDRLLAEARIEDLTAPAPRGTYIPISKRDRLYNALAARQAQDKSPNAVLRCVEVAMQPVRYAGGSELFESRRQALNERLLHLGVELGADGRIKQSKPAKTTTEASERTRRFRGKLQARGVHPRVLAACDKEIRDENYFHTVLEAAKSLAQEIRRQTGLTSDGRQLVKEALEFKPGESLPRLAFNKLDTKTDQSEHFGLTNLCHGVFGAFRNPTAHVPREQWEVPEEDALDICSSISLLHRRLDQAIPVPDELAGGPPG